MRVERNRCSASVLCHAIPVVEVATHCVAVALVQQIGTHLVGLYTHRQQAMHHDVCISVDLRESRTLRKRYTRGR